MPRRKIAIISVVVVAWLGAMSVGFLRLWKYEGAAGKGGLAPASWQGDSRLARDPNRYTLLMLVHPHCPCTRASIAELSRLMAECHGSLSAQVVMVRPEGANAGWERTGTWASAAAIPGVNVMCDDGGRIAEQFGAATSGQVFVYDPKGRLAFSGGITAARGHEGDNAGRSAIVAIVLGNASQISTPVYGCPLATPATQQSCKGSDACKK